MSITCHEFLNRVRTLHNIDGWQLPELSNAQRKAFMDDPVGFFIRADDPTASVIWREVEKRQRP